MHKRSIIFGVILLVLTALTILFSAEKAKVVAGGLFVLLFIIDFWAVRHIFIVIKELEKQIQIDLKDVISPLLVIFGWMLYSLVQLMSVLFAFESLQIDISLFKWVFPLVALKAIWLIIQLGRRPLKLPLLSDKLKMVDLAIYIIFVYTGASISAFTLETFIPLADWKFELRSLLKIALIGLCALSCLVPIIFYQKLKSYWIKRELQ